MGEATPARRRQERRVPAGITPLQFLGQEVDRCLLYGPQVL